MANQMCTVLCVGISWAFLGGTAPAFACCAPGPATAQASDATEQVCTLDVGGMSCGSCAGAVEQTAKSVAGVSAADVSFQEGKAVVRYRADKTNPHAIADMLTESGFPSSVTSP